MLGHGGLIFLCIIGMFMGGLLPGRALALGRAEPLDWWQALAVGVILIVGMGVVGWLRRWRGTAVLAGSGLTGAVLVFCGVATGDWRWPGEAATRVRPSLHVGVITALDIAWRPDGATPPLAQALGPGVRLTPVARIDVEGLKAFDRLMIAQPRRLAPEELVAIDAWVRGGGRAVLFDDPWLVWPDAPPQGDRRAPPLSSMLDPLIGHWGLRLEPADLTRPQPERRFLGGGALVIVDRASRFAVKTGSCRVEQGGLMALCRIGRGAVRLVADTDMLDARLWTDDPARPDRRARWAADTPDLIVDWLADPENGAEKAGFSWIADDARLIVGVRWAMLFGLGWAILGAGGLWAWARLGAAGKNRLRDAERR